MKTILRYEIATEWMLEEDAQYITETNIDSPRETIFDTLEDAMSNLMNVFLWGKDKSGFVGCFVEEWHENDGGLPVAGQAYAHLYTDAWAEHLRHDATVRKRFNATKEHPTGNLLDTVTCLADAALSNLVTASDLITHERDDRWKREFGLAVQPLENLLEKLESKTDGTMGMHQL
jgi:hypothetical protein